MMKLYIKAKSKKEINERLAKGERVFGTNYSIFEDGGTYALDSLKEDVIIVTYERMHGGNPIAKAYGNYITTKKKVI